MINWDDPDFKAAGAFTLINSHTCISFLTWSISPPQGHFYATVQSVTVKCSDAEKPNADTTSYVYQNASGDSNPQVALSNLSTLLNAAPVVGVSGMHGMIVALVAVFLAFVHLF
jgi:hypothetical protein